MLNTFVVFCIIILAGTLQGFSGFGFGLTLMATLPFLISITTTSVLISVATAIISFYMVWRNRLSLDLKLVIFPLIGSFLFIPVGVFLLNYFDEIILKQLLGFFLILISIFFLLRKNQYINIKPTRLNGMMVGMINGVLTGMLTVGGPPLVFYFSNVTKNKYEYKVSLDFIFFCNSIYRLVWLFLFGNITGEILPTLTAAIVAAMLGTVIGFRLLKKTDRAVVLKYIYIFMILAGFSLIIL